MRLSDLRPAAFADRGWMQLDNAATMYPSASSARTTTLFRISATLTEPVQVGDLQRALDKIAPRFPYFLVELCAGFFWYYLVPAPGRPRLMRDSRFPCMNFPRNKHGFYLFRVRVFRTRIAVEFSHIITDGTGAVSFLRALLLEYFAQRGIHAEEPSDIMKSDGNAQPEEFEDAFRRFFKPEIPGPVPMRRSFQVPDALLPVGVYPIVTGIVPVSSLKARAKEQGVTLTVYLVALLLDALQEVYFSGTAPGRKHGKVVRVEVPVNLRKLYHSSTMRNFSLYVTPAIDPRLGRYRFDEIVGEVHHFMQVAVSERAINQQIARNIRSEAHPVIRATPLVVKNLIMPGIFYRLGESLFASCLTNLGTASMPSPLNDHIERFEFLPAPSGTNKSNCGLISFRDHAYISFGRVIAEPRIERLFFTSLRKQGVPVKIETN